MKPTEVQIVSIKENENNLKMNEKTEVIASQDTMGHKKYTIRADRMYRAECCSKGSRPLATIEWYLIKKNQRFNFGDQSVNGTDAFDSTTSSMVPLGAEQQGGKMVSEGTIIASIVETQQVSDVILLHILMGCANKCRAMKTFV